jgi:tRNA threonylcarbamoyladenosine biosynthesis protein TsaB
MLILGIDTSGKSGGVTLAEGTNNELRVLESSGIAGGTFSAQLVPVIASLLEKHGLSPEKIGGYAVVSGPGSFTGLRVGLSAVKGLAEVLGTPIATVSLLEALASLARKEGRVAAAFDAGRSEVFYGLYQVSSTAVARIEESLLPHAEFFEQLNHEELDAAITSDAALAELASHAHTKVVPEVADRPGRETIARFGLRKLLAGETVSPEALDANYLRRSDAELFFKGL